MNHLCQSAHTLFFYWISLHCAAYDKIIKIKTKAKTKAKANKITKLRDPVGQNFKSDVLSIRQKNQTKTNVYESLYVHTLTITLLFMFQQKK